MSGSIIDRWYRKDGEQTSRKGRGLRYRAMYRGTDGRQHSKSFPRKSVAERWLRTELYRLDRGDWIDPSAGSMTLEVWDETWLRGLPGLKPKTINGYDQLLRSRVLPTFGSVPLSRITPMAVREWLADMADEGLSPARARQARQVLSQMLAQAVDDGLIARNPCDRVDAPKVRPRRQRFLDASQLEMLAAACEERQQGAGALVFFLGWSGLRWGEAVALRVESVVADRRRVRVREAATEVGGRLVFGSPKTHEPRTVIVPRFVVERLAPLLSGKKPEDLVFTAPRGGVWRGSNFRRRVFSPAARAAGVAPDLVPHDLRDTAASLMIASGASIKAVQRALGHASAKVTLDVYGSLYEEDLDALADRMEARYGDPKVAPVLPEVG
jgi:integrase